MHKISARDCCRAAGHAVAGRFFEQESSCAGIGGQLSAEEGSVMLSLRADPAAIEEAVITLGQDAAAGSIAQGICDFIKSPAGLAVVKEWNRGFFERAARRVKQT